MNLTNLIGKQVFAIYEGEMVGTISDIILNNHNSKISALKIFDEEENEYIIKFNNIVKLNELCLISNKTKLSEISEIKKSSYLGKLVVSENAELLGTINDLIFESNGNVSCFITDCGKNLNPKHLTYRKQFVYYCQKKICINNYKPKSKISSSLKDVKVSVLNFDSNFVLPNKIQFNTDTIIGKTVKDTLFGLNNEIIIKANQIINERIIEDASKHNRLNQLYFLANK